MISSVVVSHQLASLEFQLLQVYQLLKLLRHPQVLSSKNIIKTDDNTYTKKNSISHYSYGSIRRTKLTTDLQ